MTDGKSSHGKELIDNIMSDVADSNTEHVSTQPPPRVPQMTTISIAPSESLQDHLALREELTQVRSELKKTREEAHSAGDSHKDAENKAWGYLHDLRKAQEDNRNMSEAYRVTQKEAEIALQHEKVRYNRLQTKMAKVEKISHHTQLRLDVKEDELRQWKDELFNLQPRSQVSDMQIDDKWDRLCGNISRWIDDQAGTMAKLDLELKRLDREMQISDSTLHFWNKDVQVLANQLKHDPCVMENLIRFNIHRHLQKHIFAERIYVFGLDHEHAKLLAAIEQEMRTSQPRKDDDSINKWRSETLIAWCAMSDSIAHQKSVAQSITREAEMFLGPFLPEQAAKAFTVFHVDINLPAIELACTMRQSISAYRFISLTDREDKQFRPPGFPSLRKTNAIHMEDLATSDILDVNSNKLLKPSRLQPDKDGFIGQRIITLQPSLYRHSKDTFVLLNKELLLVKLSSPVQHRGKPREIESSRNALGGFGFFK